MQDKIDRLKKRQQLKANFKDEHLYIEIADDINVISHQISEIDHNLLTDQESFFNDRFNFSLTNIVSETNQIDDILSTLKSSYEKEKLNLLINDSKNAVLENIIKPFGIAKYIIAKYDKDGGNVTTTHNFKNGIVANVGDLDRQRDWERSKNNTINREPYDKISKIDRFGNLVYNKDGRQVKESFNTIKKKEIESKIPEGGTIKDGYTNKEIGIKINGRIEKKVSIDLEHITSVKAIEQNPENHLYAPSGSSEGRLDYRVNLARNDQNLTLIDGNLNRSKGAKDLQEWNDSKKSGDPSKTNGEAYETQRNLIEKEAKKSKQFLRKKEFENKSKKISKEIVSTGVSEAGRMGLQQAVGLLLKELTESVYDEISDIYHCGFKNKNKVDESFFKVLKQRLMTICDRIILKWKDVVMAFGDGLLSGFLSNFVTVIINMFVSTGKKVVRLIREGFFSLFRALKLLLSPPDGMSMKEAAHASSKLVVAGLAITGGILLEQYVDTFFKALPFSDIISTVIVGMVTGLATALLVFLIDKLDFFGVENKNLNTFINSKLDEYTEDSINNIEKILSELSAH